MITFSLRDRSAWAGALILWAWMAGIASGTALTTDKIILEEELLDEAGHYFIYEEGHVNLRIIENRWVVIFLDEERLVTEPLWPELFLRWEHQHNTDLRGTLTLRKGSGPYLSSERVMPPPHFFRVWLMRLSPDEEEVEHTFPFVVFRQTP